MASRRPLLRIPYQKALPDPVDIIPASASTLDGAVAALARFLTAPVMPPVSDAIASDFATTPRTVILSGAGLSVASGLPDYRGVKGTYRVNQNYRPTFYHEFISSHSTRKRYWARSFLGWPAFTAARPNVAHHALARLTKGADGRGPVHAVITQNVDSFHSDVHPAIPTVDLHGQLRVVACVTCGHTLPREQFQQDLRRLNPSWATLSDDLQEHRRRTEADSTMVSSELQSRYLSQGVRVNPDGDVDVEGVDYEQFRYPVCPECIVDASLLSLSPSGNEVIVERDVDGALTARSTAGILKPNVVMFGESIPTPTTLAAEQLIDASDRMLILGTSLATYSAWRLVMRAMTRGHRIGIVNVGGVREEGKIVRMIQDTYRLRSSSKGDVDGSYGVRIAQPLDELLPLVVRDV